METPTYFDFHFHPVFKKYITAFDEVYPSPRASAELLGEMDLKHILIDIVDTELLHMLESQACIDQMNKGALTTGIAAIASIERMFSNKKGDLFGKILNSKLTKPFDQDYMDKIRNGEISYYHLFIKELELYKKLRKDNIIQIATRGDDGQAKRNIKLAIGMEGGHCLCRTMIGNPNQEEDLKDIGDKGAAIYNDFRQYKFLSAAESLKHLQQAMWDEGLDLFYLTLTHLSNISEQHLATHAYGMKFLKDNSKYPAGNGISYKGKEVIDAAYTLQVKTSKGKKELAPVLIDIKHMSLKSRLDFYNYRKEKKYNFPILATHMGVTGYSIHEWTNALEEKTSIRGAAPTVKVTMDRKVAGQWGVINKTFTFNAWSINLMNEDIIMVLASDGLIGVSLDVRILGWQSFIGKGDKEEFLSVEDFKYFFPHESVNIESAVLEGFEPPQESYLKPTREERHPLALCFNILHIVSVGKIGLNDTIDPWKKICIGSDFDGLIEPVIICRDATQLPDLTSYLIRWMPIAEKAYRAENGGPPLLKRDQEGEADMKDLRIKVNDIMYNNGNEFLMKWQKGKLQQNKNDENKIII